MHARLLALFIRSCLGVLLILNGPANALAIGFVSSRSCSTETPNNPTQSCKKCCGLCSGGIRGNTTPKNTNAKDDSIRPTCPICPSCPNFPNGCCVSCPCKAPCAPPLAFVLPEFPELISHVQDVAISLSESPADEVIVPPRYTQFVAITI